MTEATELASDALTKVTAEPIAMTVIDPDQWEPCSPGYLTRGGSCDAPRVWNALEGNHWHPKLASGRDRLAAELAAYISRPAAEVVAKPLEWEYHERPVRTYEASDERGLMYYINQSFGSDSYYFTTVRFNNGSTLYDGDDLPSAQAAAQADYERRIRSALATPALAGTEPAGEVVWAVERWKAEVENRPLRNVHRRSLDDTWRQVIRHFGGDDEALCGPRHDDLVAANPAAALRDQSEA